MSAVAESHQRTGAANALEVRVRKCYATCKDSGFQLETEFKVLPGITILLGPSGAGKSTLLRCIAGLSDPEQGRIAIGERVLFDAGQRISVGPAQRGVGFVFQNLALFPHLNVRENVAYGLRRLDAKERERRMANILESFQIAHLRKRLPREISGGEQQRVALARSLVPEPCVLLLDEPLSSLDVRTKTGIIDDMRRWNEARRIPILYVTHAHEEVFALGERVVALDQGRIVAEGSPLDVVSTPRHETMAQFAGFENLFDATVVGIQEQNGTMTCRIAGSSIELEAPPTRVAPGAEVRLGIRAGDILLASARPEMVGVGNVISGRLKRLDRSGSKIEARVDCGPEFRVHLPPGFIPSARLQASAEVWMVIRTHSCHLIHTRHPNALQRLFVFVCRGEIARRLKVPLEALGVSGVKAVSAGLSAEPGAPMTTGAKRALGQLGIPTFEHRSQNLSTGLAAKAETIFCMTKQQQQMAVKRFPWAAAKVCCLQPDADLEEPTGVDPEAFLSLARKIQGLVQQRMNVLVGVP
ncbi:MAG: Maltose/maltodextrin import ATP-binding protein MalK [Chromatiales bacterium USCg_Taylor]|nr:MAG: Maltose/maltodextrin import ATP-binding protein MalK [Chromatiales bacterium USCg_Taylor]